jgi:osmotically-inducible protein OsmY
MSNDDLVNDVNAELYWDPKIDSEAIAVSGENGVITLRGTVGSFRAKREAKNAAERVYGVERVENDLQVRLMSADGRQDAELRGDVLQALMLDTLVPKTIDASVYDGLVTLNGTAEWQYQRDEAEFVAGNIEGVIDVVDEVELTGPTPSAHDVKDSIGKALKRNAKLDADELNVESENGTITLKGTVSSWSAHDEAVAAAWAAPGVRKVKDHILVAY